MNTFQQHRDTSLPNSLDALSKSEIHYSMNILNYITDQVPLAASLFLKEMTRVLLA
jgi:hypothetical protein